MTRRYHWVVMGGLHILTPTRYPQVTETMILVDLVVGLAAVIASATLLFLA